MVDKSIFSKFEIDDQELEQQIHQALGTNGDADMLEVIDKTVSNFEPGTILTGKIVNYIGDDVIVEVGLKSEGTVSASEFDDPSEINIGDNVEEPRLVCTLGPLQALEGGCDIYPELACGSIVYRVADLMSPQQREVTHAVGAATLAALLEQRPPSAVMVGVEPSHFSFLEEPLRNWVPVDWQRLTYDNGLQVYSRP